MIDVRELIKSFGNRVALARVSLSVEAGERVTLVGPNGAGKTTLLRVLATLTRPTAGSVRIAGLDTAKVGEKVRRCIGFLSHRTLLYGDLTVEQNLRFYAQMYDLEDAPTRIAELVERMGLKAWRSELVRTLSRGMQQRLAIARAILHNPPILLLDEPDTGLDQHAADMLNDLLKAVDISQRTVLMTTHNLERGLSLGNRVVILAKGKIVYDTPRQDVSTAQLREQYYKHVTVA